MHWTRDCAYVLLEHHWPGPVMRIVSLKTPPAIIRFLVVSALSLLAFGVSNWVAGLLRDRGPLSYPRFGFPFEMMEGGSEIFDWHVNRQLFLLNAGIAAVASVILGLLGAFFCRLCPKHK
jgi:hypothetical protein